MNESYVECLVAKKPSGMLNALKILLWGITGIGVVGGMSVDKIFNKTRRKKAEKFELDRIEIFAPINSWHLDGVKNRDLKTTDYSSGVAGQPDKRYLMIYNGDRKVIMEPNPAMVKAMQSVAPRKVFSD